MMRDEFNWKGKLWDVIHGARHPSWPRVSEWAIGHVVYQLNLLRVTMTTFAVSPNKITYPVGMHEDRDDVPRIRWGLAAEFIVDISLLREWMKDPAWLKDPVQLREQWAKTWQQIQDRAKEHGIALKGAEDA